MGLLRLSDSKINQNFLLLFSSLCFICFQGQRKIYVVFIHNKYTQLSLQSTMTTMNPHCSCTEVTAPGKHTQKDAVWHRVYVKPLRVDACVQNTTLGRLFYTQHNNDEFIGKVHSQIPSGYSHAIWICATSLCYTFVKCIIGPIWSSLHPQMCSEDYIVPVYIMKKIEIFIYIIIWLHKHFIFFLNAHFNSHSDMLLLFTPTGASHHTQINLSLHFRGFYLEQ